MTNPNSDRTLTEADVEAIATAVYNKMTDGQQIEASVESISMPCYAIAPMLADLVAAIEKFQNLGAESKEANEALLEGLKQATAVFAQE